MAISEQTQSKFTVDQRAIAINFDEIALMESAVFNPKPVNILALKKVFSINLGNQEMIQEWQKPNSLLKKIYTAILMTEITRCLFIEKVMLNDHMAVWADEKEMADFLLEAEEQSKELRARQQLSEREKIEALNRLLMSACNQPLTLKQMMPLINYMLHRAKTLDYQYYLGFVKTPEEAQAVQKLIDNRFKLAMSNTRRLESIILSPYTTAKQKEEAEKLLGDYVQRFSPKKLETTRKQHTNVNLHDSVMRTQYLQGQRLNEEIVQKAIEGINYAPTAAEAAEIKTKSREDITEIPAIRMMLRPTNYQKEYSKEEKDLSYKASVFRAKLNDALGNLPENKEVITHGVPLIIGLQDLTTGLINNPTEESKKKVDKKAKAIIKKLEGNEHYKEICNTLKEWGDNTKLEPLKLPRPKWTQNTGPFYTKHEKFTQELKNIKNVSQDSNYTKEEKSQIKSLHDSLKNGIEANEIYKSYNKLSSSFSHFTGLEKIRNSLVSLAFDEKKLATPNATVKPDLTRK